MLLLRFSLSLSSIALGCLPRPGAHLRGTAKMGYPQEPCLARYLPDHARVDCSGCHMAMRTHSGVQLYCCGARVAGSWVHADENEPSLPLLWYPFSSDHSRRSPTRLPVLSCMPKCLVYRNHSLRHVAAASMVVAMGVGWRARGCRYEEPWGWDLPSTGLAFAASKSLDTFFSVGVSAAPPEMEDA
jgi:hypothetical protein